MTDYPEAGLLLVDIAGQLVDPGELGDVPVATLVAVILALPGDVLVATLGAADILALHVSDYRR